MESITPPIPLPHLLPTWRHLCSESESRRSAKSGLYLTKKFSVSLEHPSRPSPTTCGPENVVDLKENRTATRSETLLSNTMRQAKRLQATYIRERNVMNGNCFVLAASCRPKIDATTNRSLVRDTLDDVDGASSCSSL